MDDLKEQLEKEAWAADHDSPGRHKWAKLFRKSAARIEALEADNARLMGLVKEAVMHDPDNVCAGLSDEAIFAGIDAWNAANADMENYVSGVTIDWDEGMIVAAIFKAVARATLAKIKEVTDAE